ncbi:MAG TPA: hypothetical protein VKZ63_03785, partial [Kofleriaceae bacterium]|nr:hypothetical protein [Kofleriaceae bacterium]
EVRGSKGWLGIAAATSSYFEEIQGKPGMDSIRMDVMAFTLGIRPVQLGATELWLDGGMAVLASSEFESMLGSVFAVRGEHQVSRDLSLFGQLRFFAMEHDVAAAEVWGGVRAWYLALGYRSMKFNIGPPLHGPEAALSLRF